jgi:YggT family protein
MNWLSPTMGILSAVLLVYLVLLLIRIALTWISLDSRLPVMRVLGALTDPYLNWFRRFRFLRWGNLDFSPMAALAVIYFVSNMARLLAVHGRITLGIVLSITLQIVWSVASFIFLILGVASLVRFLAVKLRWGGAELWSYLDAVLQPPAYSLGRILRPRSFVPYPTTLIVLAIVNLAVWGAGELLVDQGAMLLQMLPF